jgi:ribosomal protein L21/ribosomal protein L27
VADIVDFSRNLR